MTYINFLRLFKILSFVFCKINEMKTIINKQRLMNLIDF